MYKIVFSKRADKDKKLLKAAGLDVNARKLLDVIIEDPFKVPPPYEALVGCLKGFYSRRINLQHRLVYSVDQKEQVVHVLRMWTHYEL